MGSVNGVPMSHRIKQDKQKGRTIGGRSLGASLFAVTMLALPVAAHAQQNRNWDANGTGLGNGGTGISNTTAATWSPNTDGISGPYTAWINATFDNAIFGGTAGT